jgi:hypothetical protein
MLGAGVRAIRSASPATRAAPAAAWRSAVVVSGTRAFRATQPRQGWGNLHNVWPEEDIRETIARRKEEGLLPGEDPDFFMPMEKQDRQHEFPNVYTATSDPARHNGPGKVYQVSPKAMDNITIFTKMKMEREFYRTDNYMLISKHMFDLVQDLKALQKQVLDGEGTSKLAGKSVCITGQRGCGKSATFHYLSQYSWGKTAGQVTFHPLTIRHHRHHHHHQQQQ